jgi:hypothetical protein
MYWIGVRHIRSILQMINYYNSTNYG